MELYYHSHMDKFRQGVYHAMKSGLTALEPSFAVPRADGRELTDIFFQLRLDCPEIFYATGFRYRYYPESSNIEFIPQYLFDKGKVREHQKAMNARVEKLARMAQKAGSEWDKEQFIHDFICQNVHYDKLKKPYSHEIIGPLGQGVGVCEGIAKSVKVLCDAVGIWCMIAVSEANPKKGIKYRHAWNIVRINGVYYHLDATFDNTLGHQELLRYDYFNLNDSRLFRDHEPVLYPAPVCGDGEHFYYREKKLSFTKLEDVKKRALQAMKKNRTLIFHWRGGYLTREALSEILEVLRETAREKQMYAGVSVNIPQAVFQVNFYKDQPEHAVLVEHANEGEENAASGVEPECC